MRYDLEAMIRRTRNPRRSSIVIRDIVPPAVLATDLFRSVYLPVVQTWEAAAPRMMAEYERTLSELTTDAPADITREMGLVEQELTRLFFTLTPQLRTWTLRTESWFRGKWRGAVLSATGVDVQTMIGPEDARQTMEASADWNASLVRDVSDQARQRISNAVFSGLNERKPAREVAKEVRAATGMARRRSINIASDQLSKLSNALADERRREAGIDKWKWRHSGKLHPREDHQARNGKIYTDKTAPADLPGRLPFCGCRSQAVIEFD